MKVAVRYFTRTGNTKKLAEAIAGAVGAVALDVSTPLEEKIDILFLGSSVYAAEVDASVKAFVEKNAKNIGTIVNFSTAAVARSTYKQVHKLAVKHGIGMAKEEFYCRGSFLIMHRNRPNEDDLRNAAVFAKNIVNKDGE